MTDEELNKYVNEECVILGKNIYGEIFTMARGILRRLFRTAYFDKEQKLQEITFSYTCGKTFVDKEDIVDIYLKKTRDELKEEAIAAIDKNERFPNGWWDDYEELLKGE